jgi:ribosome-binding factor A
LSHHHEKATAELQRAVQKVLVQGLQDPRTEGSLITVTSVSLSPDGRNATVNVSVLPEKNESKVHGALVHSASFVRRQAAELLALKIMPQLAFVIDRSFKKQAQVLDALNKVAAEREQQGKAAQPTDPQEPPRAQH